MVSEVITLFLLFLDVILWEQKRTEHGTRVGVPHFFPKQADNGLFVGVVMFCLLFGFVFLSSMRILFSSGSLLLLLLFCLLVAPDSSSFHIVIISLLLSDVVLLSSFLFLCSFSTFSFLSFVLGLPARVSVPLSLHSLTSFCLSHTSPPFLPSPPLPTSSWPPQTSTSGAPPWPTQTYPATSWQTPAQSAPPPACTRPPRSGGPCN